MRVLAALLITAAVMGAAVWGLLAAFKATDVDTPPGSRTVVTFAISMVREPQDQRDVHAEAVYSACRADLPEASASPLRPLGDGRYRFAVTPALDASDRKEVRGCLQDLRIAHVRATVLDMTRDGGGADAAPRPSSGGG